MPAGDFFAGGQRTALEPGEIVLAVSFVITRDAAYIKLLNPAARYAMVGAFAAVSANGVPRVAITGARRGGAFRWREAEQTLGASFAAERLGELQLDTPDLREDLFADAPYRRHLAGVLARRAVGMAAESRPGVVVLTQGARPIIEAAS